MAALNDNEAQALERLISVLDRLAADPVEQESYLRSLNLSNADELALDLDDLLPMMIPSIARISRRHDAVEKLSSLNRQLDAMSGATSRELWTFQALHTSPQWDTIRKLASEAKAVLADPE